MSKAVLDELNIRSVNPGACWGPDGWIEEEGKLVSSINPATGEVLAQVVQASEAAYETVVNHTEEAFKSWRMVPAPKRGEVVRDLGVALREKKEALGDLVTLEMGKILLAERDVLELGEGLVELGEGLVGLGVVGPAGMGGCTLRTPHMNIFYFLG